MGKIKPPKAHALAIHDSSHNKHHRSDSSQKNQQQKDKGKAHSHPKKEGYTKPFNDSSGSRNEKGKKGNRCTYCQRGFHPESSCMKKQIDQMAEILQKHNLGDHIPQGAKKKTEDPPHGRGNNFHALVAINSSPDAWIIDSGASHHMAAAKEVYSSLDACKGPPILMGDDSPIEVIGKGRVELLHGSFEDVLHVPKLSVNLLLVYHITHSSTGKRVEFTPDVVNIYDLHSSAKIATGEGYRLFIPSTDKLIIEQSVKFEESLSHAPQLPHADTFYRPHVRDDDLVHLDAETDHADAEEEHADAEIESSDTNLVNANDDPHPSPDGASSSESYSPVINERTRSLREIYAQDQPTARNGLVGDNSDLQRTSSEFIEPPLVLIATEPSPSWHCHLVQSFDPQSYAEAAGHPSSESAMKEEYNSLLENQTWDLVPLPSGRKLVRCKWVYKTKSAADGQIIRRKARLVAKGFQQVHGIDYDETCAPVAKMDSI
eukprot:PITA_01912